jgi:hypothetical protein
MIRSKTPKPKTCKVCKSKFHSVMPMATVCGPMCALTHARSARGKAEKVRQVKERRETKAKLDAIKTIPQLIKEAQVAFNAFIRARDAQKPCICCGKPLGDGDVGGRFDCGHYRSVGSASHLRFNEANAHGQRKYCNRHGAGRAVDYRIGLISRLGLDCVEALESNNTPHKWEREELIAIKATYTAKAKELKARQE